VTDVQTLSGALRDGALMALNALWRSGVQTFTASGRQMRAKASDGAETADAPGRLRRDGGDRLAEGLSATRAALFLVGAGLELVGIVLVASPDLVPGALRLVAWIRPRWRRIENRLRRVLRLPPRGVTHHGSASLRGKVSMSASGVVGVDPNASLDAKVAFLIRRDREAQMEMNTLTKRLSAVEAGMDERIAQLRAEMETHVANEIAAAREDYRFARMVGATLLAAGLGLTTAANFV
jgi:hypothetical protein